MASKKIKKTLLMSALLAGVFFANSLMVCAADSELRQQIDYYQDSANKKAREAVIAKQKWMQSPNFQTQNEFNRLRDQAISMYKNLEAMQKAAKAAEDASYWSIASDTVTGTVNDLGGYISDAATKLFGASDNDLYGPNWQQINADYKAMSEKYRDIIKRRDAAKLKPDNAAEINAINEEIKQMKLRYESLRKSIRIEQQNVGFATTFWGEDYMGRYIQACTENFDPVSTIISIVTLNPKIMYDVFKPAILLKLGDGYIYPKGNLTPQIADALVIDIMNVGPDQVKQVTDYISSVGVVDKAKEKILDKYKDEMAKQFKGLQEPLMKSVKAKIEKEMSEEFLAHVHNLPYENLPGGKAGDMSEAMAKYFESKAVRDKFMKKTEEGIQKELTQVMSMNRSGFAAAKKSAMSGVLDNVGIGVDFIGEFAALYANSPLLTSALDSANFRAGKIREVYKAKIKSKELDPYEITENDYVNSVWKGEWKTNSAAAQAIIDKAKTSADESIAAKKPLVQANDQVEQADAKSNDSEYIMPPSVNQNYRSAEEAIERDLASGALSAEDFIQSEASAFQLAYDTLKTAYDNNEAVRNKKKHALPYDLTQIINDPSVRHFYTEIDAECDKYQSAINAMMGDLDTAKKENRKRLSEKGMRVVDEIKVLAEREKQINADIASSDIGKPAGAYQNINSYLERKNEIYTRWYSLREKVNSEKFDKNDLQTLLAFVDEYSKADEEIIKIVPQALQASQNAADRFIPAYCSVIDDLTSLINAEGQWADLALNQNFNMAVSGDNYYAPQNQEYKPSRVNENFINDLNNFNNYVETWNYNINAYLPKYESDYMKNWVQAVSSYAPAIEEYKRFNDEMDDKSSRRSNIFTRSVYAILNDNTMEPLSPDEKKLMHYFRYFSDGPTASYVKPTKSYASSLVQSKTTPEYLKELGDKILKPEALKVILNDDSIIEEAQKLYPINDKIEAGYQAVSGDFPGFNRSVSLPSSVRLLNVSFDQYNDYKIFVKKIDNYYKGLQDLPVIINQIANDKANYVDSIKSYYEQIIKVNNDEFDKISKLLDASKVAEAEEELNNITNLYPSYPDLPEGVCIDSSVKPENLGVQQQLDECSNKRRDLRIRIQDIKNGNNGRTPFTPPVDNAKQMVILNFYNQFKQAYESKNPSLVLNMISNDWDAGDGSTLSDLESNLNRMFRVFNQITYDISNLTISKQSGNIYKVSYVVTIKGEIYAINTHHEEKSQVNEEIIFDDKGNIKIYKTLDGRYWYVE